MRPDHNMLLLFLSIYICKSFLSKGKKNLVGWIVSQKPNSIPFLPWKFKFYPSVFVIYCIGWIFLQFFKRLLSMFLSTDDLFLTLQQAWSRKKAFPKRVLSFFTFFDRYCTIYWSPVTGRRVLLKFSKVPRHVVRYRPGLNFPSVVFNGNW